MSESYLMNNYGSKAITLAKGDGSWLWDTEGNQYLDALTGIAVCGLGHANPVVAKRVSQQANTLVHCSNLYSISEQQQLSKVLCDAAAMQRVFFSNSGAEANEAAIKLARLHGHRKDIAVPTIIVMEGAFHGRTMATLSATHAEKVKTGFYPLVEAFERAPYNDLAAIREIAKHNPNIVAVLVEPVQGEAGVNIPDDNYLTGLRQICTEHDWLLMVDEIQTGNGRTGKYFAYQHEPDCLPDVVTTAKGLGNGFPIGACLAQGKAADYFAPGSHGSTFGGNPLVCSAALAVYEQISEHNILDNAANMGEYIRAGIEANISDQQSIKEVRCKGMMIAVEFHRDCAELVDLTLNHGLLINVAGGNRVRLLPALNITQQDADTLIEKLCTVINLWNEASV